MVATFARRWRGFDFEKPNWIFSRGKQTETVPRPPFFTCIKRLLNENHDERAQRAAPTAASTSATAHAT